MRKNTVQAKQWLDKCYSNSAPSRQIVEKWFAGIKRGHTNTDDAKQIWQLFQKTKKVHKIVLADCKLTLREIADSLKISEGSIFTISYEHLSMRKLCSKWVPRLLTVDQKRTTRRRFRALFRDVRHVRAI